MPSAPITPNQMLGARLLLGWSRERLAAHADTTTAFVWNYERDGRIVKMLSRERSFDGFAAIRAALEAAGIEFIEENAGGPGVRLRKVGR